MKNVSLLAILSFLLTTSVNSQVQFGNATIIDTASEAFISKIEVVDIDNDNNVDLLTVTSGGRLDLYKNLGAANFQDNSQIGSGFNAGFSAADLNGDGNLDLFGSTNDYGIGWLRNEGNASFTIDTLPNSVNLDIELNKISDIDNDGDLDILFKPSYLDTIFSRTNNGFGSFFNQDLVISSFFNMDYLFALDINNDNIDDVITLSKNNPSTVLYVNDGSGNYSGAGNYSLYNTSGIEEIVTSDIENDSDLDLVISAAGWQNNYTIYWYENLGNGDSLIYHPIETNHNTPFKVRSGDIDNDGKEDILAFSNVWDDSTVIGWYKNLGNGQFSTYNILMTVFEDIQDINIADVNNDGKLDIVTASNIHTNIYWYENLSADIGTVVQGRVFWDKNENGAFDAGDEALAGAALNLSPEGYTTYTNPDGFYYLFSSDSGSHQITITPPLRVTCDGFQEFETVIPVGGIINFDFNPAGDTINQDFSFYSVDSCVELSGRVFNDINQNGVQDAGENGYYNFKITKNGSVVGVTNFNGDYNFSASLGETYQIGVVPPYTSGYFGCTGNPLAYTQTHPLSPDTYSVLVDVTSSNEDYNFGFIQEEGEIDARVVSVRFEYGNYAGATFSAFMDFKFSGNQTEACTLRLEHDTLVNIQLADIPFTSQGDDFVEWIFAPGTAPDWHCMVMNCSIDTNAQVGDTLFYEATYNCGTLIDFCPNNNTMNNAVVINEDGFRLMNTANTKMLSLNNQGEMPEFITQDENTFSFVTFFQNPLEETSYNLTIIDTLPEELDASTISIPFSNFPFTYTVNLESNVLIVTYKNIDLKPYTEDLLKSYGFLQFNVMMKPNLPDGTRFTNKSYVYYNSVEEVVTNEVSHMIRITTDIVEFDEKRIEVSIYPNPFNQQTIFEINRKVESSYDLQLVDISGRILQSYEQLSTNKVVIERKGLPAGLYFINMLDSKSKKALNSRKVFIY